MKLILASASPRRRELMSVMGYEYEVIPADIDETLPENISAQEAVEYLARKKALSVLEKNPGCTVVGSDTVVVCDGKILGKPTDREEAKKMLSMLSGRKHLVCTGLCVCDSGRTESLVNVTEVYFYPLSEETVGSYIDTGEPMDKAGAYGIQGYGAALVEKINGDYFSVMGLPLSQTVRILSKFGIKNKISL